MPIFTCLAAVVYFLRSKGLLNGLAAGTNCVFRDESMHMAFSFEVVKTVRQEEPAIFDDALAANIYEMLEEAIACEMQFAEDLLSGGVAGVLHQNSFIFCFNNLANRMYRRRAGVLSQ